MLAGRLLCGKSTHANKFIYKNVPKGRTGRGVEREGASDALWREVDRVEYAIGLQGMANGLDQTVVLDVDGQARGKGPQNLGNDVSDCLQWRESLEEGGRNGYCRTEMAPRHGATDGNGKDNSYGIGESNGEQCFTRKASA